MGYWRSLQVSCLRNNYRLKVGGLEGWKSGMDRGRLLTGDRGRGTGEKMFGLHGDPPFVGSDDVGCPGYSYKTFPRNSSRPSLPILACNFVRATKQGSVAKIIASKAGYKSCNNPLSSSL